MKRQLEILLGQHLGHLYMKLFNVQRVERFGVCLFEVGYSLVEVSKSHWSYAQPLKKMMNEETQLRREVFD